MTGPEIMAVVGFFVLVFGAMFGVWRYVESKIVSVRQDATTAASTAQATATLTHDDLQAHKLHVAETYVSKQGLREAVEPIMDAIQGVKGAVDHLGGRIDGIYHQGGAPRARKPQQ